MIAFNRLNSRNQGRLQMKAFSRFFSLPLSIRSRFVIVLSIAKVHSDPLVCVAESTE